MSAKLGALPQLGASVAKLELCVYCPKLCRAACPVSDADPRETVTPWGKMSTTFFLARGDLPIDASSAAPAWACTGCYACRERCDHRNEVASTLLEARAELFARGVAPEAAKRAARGFGEQSAVFAQAMRDAGTRAGASADARVALAVGCGYGHESLRAELADAIVAARALVGEDVRVLGACCGAALAMAGDRAAFEQNARVLATALGGATRLVVVDPGCAITMRHALAAAGVALEPELLVDLAARGVDRLRPLAGAPASVRWHDPCQLGRGLGRYDEPRAILTRLLGRAPEEFADARERGACSGGGGLLPATMPDVSRAIADRRVAAHVEAGGGEIVTACASSLRRFRSRGARASDLVSWIARGLASEPTPG